MYIYLKSSNRFCTYEIFELVFCMQQEIIAAGDAAVLVYREETSTEDVTPEGVAAAMKQGIKDRTTKLMIKLGKMTAVANPAHGPEFLEEVHCRFMRLFFVYYAFIIT